MELKLSLIEGFRAASQGKKLLIDANLSTQVNRSRYFRHEELTDLPTEEIIYRGYRECIGAKSGLAFYRIPIYIKFGNFTKCDYKNGYIDDYGRPTTAEYGEP